WFRGRVTDLTKRIFQYHLPPNTLGQVNGPAFTGRETGGPDCSLHIRNLTLTDSGNYTVATEGHVTAIGYVTMKVSDRFTNENEVFYPCRDKYPPRSKAGAGSGPLLETRRSGLWIILGSSAAILALTSALLYFLLRTRCRKNHIPNQSALTFYSNLSSSEENLEPGNQAVY
ncbi:Carcinoembryonic antigen-related cell adhesion molecule 16, partial [Varanus komodoensis]